MGGYLKKTLFMSLIEANKHLWLIVESHYITVRIRLGIARKPTTDDFF